MMTIGAKVLPSFAIPRGCSRKRTMRIAQVTPTIVPVDILGATTSIPWFFVSDIAFYAG